MSMHFRRDEGSRNTITSQRDSERRLPILPQKQRALLRKVTAELDCLREHVEVARRETCVLSMDDDFQSLSEALQTVIADLRHAQAALSWLAGAHEAKAPGDRAHV